MNKHITLALVLLLIILCMILIAATMADIALDKPPFDFTPILSVDAATFNAANNQ